MVKPSSESLHPKAGARFAMTRIGPAPQESAQPALVYRVEVFVAGGETFEANLSQNDEGSWSLDGIPASHWAHNETLKLARVLKKNPVGSLLRWRPGPAS